MASKLGVYNGALNIELGERKLSRLSEARPSRRRLDSVWDGDTGVLWCLEQGLWNFAMESVALTYSPSVTPAFGYTYAFNKPEHWRRTALVSDDANFCNKLVDYVDETGYFFANVDTLYVKYVSSDSQRGLDLSLWPANFTKFVQVHFAHSICMATTNSQERTDALEKKAKRMLNLARSTDAMDESPRFPPAGSWSRARRGGGGNTNDRGNTGQLIG